MNDLKNKNIIVTGASGGIGNSIIEQLHNCGANILASGTKIEKLEELKKKFENIKILNFDISKSDEIESFIKNATANLGEQLDCLVNNAAYDVERKKSLQARADMLEADVSACNMKLQDAREILQKTSIEPERVRKQAEGVQKALEKVNKEMGYIVDERVTCDKEITCQVLKRKQADEVKRNLIHKLELHQDTIMHRQRDVDTVKTNVKLEKARRDQLAEASISLEINRKAVDDRMQRETENISIIKKQLEILRRR